MANFNAGTTVDTSKVTPNANPDITGLTPFTTSDSDIAINNYYTITVDTAGVTFNSTEQFYVKVVFKMGSEGTELYVMQLFDALTAPNTTVTFDGYYDVPFDEVTLEMQIVSATIYDQAA